MQVHAGPGQMESQADPSFQLVSTVPARSNLTENASLERKIEHYGNAKECQILIFLLDYFCPVLYLQAHLALRASVKHKKVQAG